MKQVKVTFAVCSDTLKNLDVIRTILREEGKVKLYNYAKKYSIKLLENQILFNYYDQ